ncbi:MAG TPA: hemerythrin domain-containing protein [Planctomycetota bacterium]|nr:hemerythrin domain-containing protein [Planctomycetota bacterium]
MAQTKTIDAIRFLTADHKLLRGLLSDLESTTERGAKKRSDILDRLQAAIRAHAKVEEEIFYPAFHDAAKSKEDNAKFLEATEEHGLVDIVLPELEATSTTSEVFGAKAKVLKDLIEHHAEEEEEEMFPRARKLLGKQRLGDLGAEMAVRHEQLLAEHSGARKTRARR